MKSWIHFILPNDEYKQQKILYMMAEGFLLTLIAIVVVLCLNLFIPINLTLAAVLVIGVALTYTTVSYSLSGIEYTNLTTKRPFKQNEKRY